jgi:hypothetical protein
MRPQSVHAKPVKPEQIRELSRRMDELLKRTRRSYRKIGDRLQRMLQLCEESQCTLRLPNRRT